MKNDTIKEMFKAQKRFQLDTKSALATLKTALKAADKVYKEDTRPDELEALAAWDNVYLPARKVYWSVASIAWDKYLEAKKVGNWDKQNPVWEFTNTKKPDDWKGVKLELKNFEKERKVYEPLSREELIDLIAKRSKEFKIADKALEDYNTKYDPQDLKKWSPEKIALTKTYHTLHRKTENLRRRLHDWNYNTGRSYEVDGWVPTKESAGKHF